MTLRLTPNQYRTLVRALFIARKVLDGSELQDDTPARDMKSLITTVHEAAEAFGSQAMFEGNPADGGVLVQVEQDSLTAITEWYEEFAFWDILEERLAMRDIADERTEAQWTWLPEAEKNAIYDKYLDFYFDEFAANGVQNLRIGPADPERKHLPPWMPTFENEDLAPPDPPAPGGGSKIIEFPGRPKRKPGE